MKAKLLGVMLFVFMLAPSLSHAKGVPLFFQTGDELFEVEGAPQFQDGFSVGYACKRFGLFGADVWTWDCKLMAINVEQFSAGDLTDAEKTEYATKFSEGDRKRSLWNHYGVLILLLVVAGFAIVKRQSG